jgi:hypothetical protein
MRVSLTTAAAAAKSPRPIRQTITTLSRKGLQSLMMKVIGSNDCNVGCQEDQYPLTGGGAHDVQ